MDVGSFCGQSLMRRASIWVGRLLLKRGNKKDHKASSFDVETSMD